MTIPTLTAFHFDLTEVQAFDLDGEVCILAKGICEALGLGNVGQALAGLDDDEKGSITTNDGTPGSPVRAYVTESGLYSLVLRSRRPEAKAFKRWVTHEVLPTIRKHGVYAAPATVDAMLADPDAMIAVLTSLKEERARRAEVEARAAIDAPKASAFDAFLSTTGDYSVNEAAKILSRHPEIETGEVRLRQWMYDNGWIYRSSDGPRAYQNRMDQGRLTERARFHYHPKTGEKVADTPQVRVTARGIQALADALRRTQVAA